MLIITKTCFTKSTIYLNTYTYVGKYLHHPRLRLTQCITTVYNFSHCSSTGSTGTDYFMLVGKYPYLLVYYWYVVWRGQVYWIIWQIINIVEVVKEQLVSSFMCVCTAVSPWRKNILLTRISFIRYLFQSSFS